MSLDTVDHVAVSVKDIAQAVQWYTKTFHCKVAYQDGTWAMLDFANLKVALVIPEQHPSHMAFVSPDAERYGSLRPHRDGTRSVYITDPAGNTIEIMAKQQQPSEETE
jgi:catechol 2,3-dioxygenase-like lactoylglutathione lyase family enzyme